MNMQLRQQILSKPELERMVLSYLHMLPGCQHLFSVQIAHRPKSQRNWTLVGTEPPLSTTAENQARNAIVALQRDFQLPA